MAAKRSYVDRPNKMASDASHAVPIGGREAGGDPFARCAVTGGMKTRASTIVVAFALAASTLVPAVAAAAPTAPSAKTAQIVPGELLVVLEDGVTAAQAAAFAQAHHVRGTYLPTVNVYVVHLPEAQATAAMARMQSDPRVVSVERSYVMEAAI